MGSIRVSDPSRQPIHECPFLDQNPYRQLNLPSCVSLEELQQTADQAMQAHAARRSPEAALSRIYGPIDPDVVSLLAQPGQWEPVRLSAYALAWPCESYDEILNAIEEFPVQYTPTFAVTDGQSPLAAVQFSFLWHWSCFLRTGNSQDLNAAFTKIADITLVSEDARAFVENIVLQIRGADAEAVYAAACDMFAMDALEQTASMAVERLQSGSGGAAAVEWVAEIVNSPFDDDLLRKSLAMVIQYGEWCSEQFRDDRPSSSRNQNDSKRLYAETDLLRDLAGQIQGLYSEAVAWRRAAEFRRECLFVHNAAQ